MDKQEVITKIEDYIKSILGSVTCTVETISDKNNISMITFPDSDTKKDFYKKAQTKPGQIAEGK
eukprot:1395753-Karenia_brevis.AAC.1